MPTAGLAEIIIAKHRNGAVTDVPLRFIKDQAKFADLDDSTAAAMASASGQPPRQQQEYDDISSSANAMPPMGSPVAGGLGTSMSSEFDDFNRAGAAPRPAAQRRDDEVPF